MKYPYNTPPLLAVFLLGFSLNAYADSHSGLNRSLQQTTEAKVKWVKLSDGRKHPVCSLPGFRPYSKSENGKRIYRCFKTPPLGWFAAVIPPTMGTASKPKKWTTINGKRYPVCEGDEKPYKHRYKLNTYICYTGNPDPKLWLSLDRKMRPKN